MGFFQDLGLDDIIRDVSAVRDEFGSLKQEVVDTALDTSSQIKQTLSDTATTITETTQQVSDDVKQSIHTPLDQGKDSNGAN